MWSPAITLNSHGSPCRGRSALATAENSASLLSGIGLAIVIAIVHAVAISVFGKDKERARG